MTTALITGANRGLGRSIAAALAKQGMTVLIGARDVSSAGEACAVIGSTAHAIALDVTDSHSVATAARRVDEDFGSLDVLVNNAGILPEATHGGNDVFDLELFQTTYATNLFGPVAMVQAFLPLLRRSAHGRIVNISTTMGSLTDQANPESPYYSMIMPAYQSSKAALNSVTISLAKALADTPIKVTSVCPGFIQTDLTPVNRDQAPLTADQAAQIAVTAATLGDDARSGMFIDSTGTIPW